MPKVRSKGKLEKKLNFTCWLKVWTKQKEGFSEGEKTYKDKDAMLPLSSNLKDKSGQAMTTLALEGLTLEA